jgi:alpha-mannosidase
VAWEESTPLEQDQIRSQDRALNLPRPLDGNQASFLTIEDSDLLLDTWKRAEDGNGTILRLIDLGGQSGTVAINVPLIAIGRIVSADAVERDQKPIVSDNPHSFKISVQPHQIVTLRLVAEPM